ncbi:MAG: response regulator transcription factor [Anaerolineales bacterium]|nr:MAG: response regulator transcription factor [Anaerolineales bacterium]
MTALRILLVDDHEVVRMGLATLLEDDPDVRIVGEAGSAREALEACQRLNPDLVILDIRLPDQPGVNVCRQIVERWPHIKVIILTSFVNDELIAEAISAGAAGYVLKQVGNQELLRAIQAVRRGEALLDPQVTQRVLQRIRQTERLLDAGAFRDLSHRELEVLHLVSQGKSNPQIAQALSLSEKTVRNHVSSLLTKLDMSNRIELATYAVKHHIGTYLRSDE